MSRRLTAAQRRRAERLFGLSTVRTLDAEERACFAQSFNDGDCEYTIELTAARP
jgi:hypothetical protein